MISKKKMEALLIAHIQTHFMSADSLGEITLDPKDAEYLAGVAVGALDFLPFETHAKLVDRINWAWQRNCGGTARDLAKIGLKSIGINPYTPRTAKPKRSQVQPGAQTDGEAGA